MTRRAQHAKRPDGIQAGTEGTSLDEDDEEHMSVMGENDSFCFRIVDMDMICDTE